MELRDVNGGGKINGSPPGFTVAVVHIECHPLLRNLCVVVQAGVEISPGERRRERFVEGIESE